MHHLQRLTFRRAIIMAQFSEHRSYYRTSHDRCFGCPNHGRFLGGKQQLSNFHHLLKTNRPRWWENSSFNHFGFVISTDFKVVWTHGRHVHLFAASTMATCFVQWPLSRWRFLWCHWRFGGGLERRCFWGNLEAFTNKASNSPELDVSGSWIRWINIPMFWRWIYMSLVCCFFNSPTCRLNLSLYLSFNYLSFTSEPRFQVSSIPTKPFPSQRKTSSQSQSSQRELRQMGWAYNFKWSRPSYWGSSRRFLDDKHQFLEFWWWLL